MQQTKSKRINIYDPSRNKFAATIDLATYDGYVVFRVNHKARTLYGVIDGISYDQDGDEIALSISYLLLFPTHAFVSSITMSLFRIELPRDEIVLSCEHLTSFLLPLSWRIIRHMPDAIHERVLLLFRTEDSCIRLLVVLGFREGKVSIAFCNTKLSYVRDQARLTECFSNFVYSNTSR